jgi:hypothetical protein
LSVGGNWTNNGTFNANNRAVTFNGSAAQTIGGSAVTSFDYVTINNSNGVSLLQNEVVNSTLTLSNGRLTLGSSNLTMGSSAAAVAGTFSASNMIVADGTGMLCKQYGGTGTYDFPSGDATDTVEYSPVTLNFTSGSFSSGQACVRVTDDKRANMPGTNYLTRFWTLTASGITGFSANVTFNYLDADVVGTEANLSAALWNGTTWNVLDAADTANNRLTGTVTGFGDFSAGESGPLAVNLASFTATRSDDHNLIAWETASELHNLGFNLWRGTSASAPDMKLNEHVIPSQAPGGTEGVAYSYDDFGITSGVTYYYWLEDVDLNGTVTRHGPVSTSGETPTAIMVKDFTASPVATSPLTAFGVISAIGLAGLWLRHRK